MIGMLLVWFTCTALNDGVLDTVLSMCHANAPDAVRLAALQYVATVSSQSGRFCDALTDQARRNTLAKLLTLTASSDASVCTNDQLLSKHLFKG